MKKHIDLQTQRDVWTEFPENTMATYNKAIEHGV